LSGLGASSDTPTKAIAETLVDFIIDARGNGDSEDDVRGACEVVLASVLDLARRLDRSQQQHGGPEAPIALRN
jgi:hypothetical protein